MFCLRKKAGQKKSDMNGLVSGSNGGLIEAEEEAKVTVIEIH